MTKISKIITVAIIGFTSLGLLFFLWHVAADKKSLPVLGEPGHVAGNFSFINQQGQIITDKDVAKKVQVVEYFFTTCPGICKVMNSNLDKVFQYFKNRKDFVILSHTVNPETDSVPVLAAYASQLKATLPNWEFLTGEKAKLYKAARQDYLLSVEDTVRTNTTEDFIHTEYVALLDKSRRIRGFYDATNKEGVRKLIEDIEFLVKEDAD
jgi:protein SCO1/2